MLSEWVRHHANKQTTINIINYVGSSPNHFAELVSFALSKNERTANTATWGLTHISEKQPQLIEPHAEELIELLMSTSSSAVRRNLCRTFQWSLIPEEYEGQLYDRCLAYILDPKEAIAVKAFSMGICERIAIKYPDLIPELCDAIESIIPTGSKGVQNRGRHILNRLGKK